MTSAHLDRLTAATGGSYRALREDEGDITLHPPFLIPLSSCSAARAAPAPPRQRFPRGASRLIPSSPRPAHSATQCRSLPCEKTPQRQLRRHGPCFSGVQVNA